MLIGLIVLSATCLAHDSDSYEDHHDHHHHGYSNAEKQLDKTIEYWRKVLYEQWRANPYQYKSHWECERWSIWRQMKAAYTMEKPKCIEYWVRWPVNEAGARTGPDEPFDGPPPVFRRAPGSIVPTQE